MRNFFTVRSATWRIKLTYKTNVMFWSSLDLRCMKKNLPLVSDMKCVETKYSGNKMACPSTTILRYLSIAWDGDLGPVLTVLWRAVVPIPVLDRKVPIIGLDELSFERRLERHTTRSRDICLKVVSRNNHEKSAIFRVMISGISGLALYQWKSMFLEISATFVYAMDLKLNLKLKKCARRA